MPTVMDLPDPLSSHPLGARSADEASPESENVEELRVFCMSLQHKLSACEETLANMMVEDLRTKHFVVEVTESEIWILNKMNEHLSKLEATLASRQANHVGMTPNIRDQDQDASGEAPPRMIGQPEFQVDSLRGVDLHLETRFQSLQQAVETPRALELRTTTFENMDVMEDLNRAQRQDAVEAHIKDLDARIFQVETKQRSGHYALSFPAEEYDKFNQKCDELEQLIVDLQTRVAHEVQITIGRENELSQLKHARFDAGFFSAAVQHVEPSQEAGGPQELVQEQQKFMAMCEEDTQRDQRQESLMETSTPDLIDLSGVSRSIDQPPSSRISRASVLDVNLAYVRIAELSSYELRASVWDVSFLCGIQVMRPSDELIVYLASLMNMVFQVGFTVLVWLSMTDGDFNDDGIVQEFLDWRVMYAHDPKYADSFTNAPLAEAVCTRNPVAMEGIMQASVYRDAHEYLEKVFGVKSGEILCLLACSLWVFECVRESEHVWWLLSSLWTTVYYSGHEELAGFQRFLSARSGLVHQENIAREDDHAAHKSIKFACSPQRALLLTVLVVIPRLAIVMSLGYAGVLFLVTSMQLSEFVLNSIALTCVLGVDELVYEIFVPRVPKIVLAKIIPLHTVRHISSVTKVIPSGFLKIMVVIALVTFIDVVHLGPVITNIEDVAHAMCGGDIGFLAAELSVGLVFAGNAQTRRGINRTRFSYLATLQRTGLKQSNPAGYNALYLDSRLPPQPALFPIPDVFQARLYQTFTVGTIAGASTNLPYAVRCNSDTFWQTAHPYVRNAISKFLDDVFGPHRPICQALKDQGYCYLFSKEGTIARFFCPATCGLNEPQSGNAFWDSEQGVPTGDCNRIMGLRLETVPCEDLPQSDPAFAAFATSGLNLLGDAIARLGNATWIAQEGSRLAHLIRSGCQAVAQNLNRFVIASMYDNVTYDVANMSCSPASLAGFGNQIRSLRFLCPRTCGCLVVAQQYKTDGKQWTRSIGITENCPQTCFNYSLSSSQ